MLTGLRTGQYDQIMRWWSSNPQSGIATVLDSVDYCYVLLPHLPYYSSPRLSYHMRSFDHLGFSCLRPSISAYRTRSFKHPCVSLIRSRIQTSLSASLPSSGSYCLNLSPFRPLLFDSCETPDKVDQSCFYAASCHHQSSLLHPPPL